MRAYTPALLRAPCASVLVAIGAAWPSAPASAQTSDLSGTVSASGAPTMQQSFVNATVANLSGLMAHDVMGNDGNAGGSLATPGGMFTLSAHACSGGGPGFGGQAGGSANADITLDYVMASATLPVGTPVSVSVRWVINSRLTAVGQDMTGCINCGAQGSVYGQIVIYVNGTPIVNKSGSHSHSQNFYDGIQDIRSGTLDVDGDMGDSTLTVLIGQTVHVFMSGTVGGATGAYGGATTDGDAQFSAVWGVTALTQGATAVLQSNPSEPAPPAAMATPAHAAEILPPRPTGPGILQCFRIPTQPLPVSACPTAGTAFSVVVLGTGPFTYQWRKGGVPIDTTANPSAANATLSLTNVSAADAGSYDCVITNPCGPLTSNAATLSIGSPPSVSEQPTSVTTCPTGSAPFSVTAAGPGPFTYNWQVQTAPNGAWLSPGDDPGSPLPCGGFAYATPPNSRSVTIGIRPCPGSPGTAQHFQVRAIVTNSCGSITSSEATYTICPADFNCSGAVNVQDIFDFLAAWFASDPRADFNGAGGISVADIFDFLAAWFAGC